VTSSKEPLVVEASRQRAFRTFTDGIDRWWPREHPLPTSSPYGGIAGVMAACASFCHPGAQRAPTRRARPSSRAGAHAG
jgi:hypothetical protein